MDLQALQQFEIRELCYFVAVAEELHFARAAQRVGINQSPLSKAISLLEQRLSVRLFQRTRRRTRLTDVGAALLPEAQALLSEVDRVRQDISAFAAGRKGRVRIGLSEGLSVGRIGCILERSFREDPDAEFTIERRSLQEQIRDLRLDRLDVGIAFSYSSNPLGLDFELSSIVLHRDHIVLAIPPGHILAEQATVRSLEACTGPYILVGEPSFGCADIEALIEPRSAAATVIHYAASVDLLLTTVAAGRGVGLLGSEQARAVIANGIVFRPLGLTRAKLTTHLLKPREDKSAAVARFIERAQRTV